MTLVLLVLLVMARALLLTIAIEVTLGLLFVRERTWSAVAVVALAQVATNPAVQLVCIATGWSPFVPLGSLPWLALGAAELAAFVAEALLYRLADVTRHPWRMSAVLNLVSFGVGIVLRLASGA
jgi:hypothetical protein